MKNKLTLIALLTGFLFTGCVKDIIENTIGNAATDFTLQLARVSAAGDTTFQVEHALNQPNAAKMLANFFVKAAAVHLNIGGEKTTTVAPRLFADINFNFTQDPKKIAGVYNFPLDNNRVSFLLNESIASVTKVSGLPVSGILEVKYDESSKTINGTIKNLQYVQTLNSAYASEILNGKFSNVGVGK